MILKEVKLTLHSLEGLLRNTFLLCRYITFGSTNASLCKEFSKSMQDEFEMSMMGELKFFLGIKINQSKDRVYVHQTK